MVSARTASPTCSVAPVTNGLSDITRHCGPSLFPVRFFSAGFMAWALKQSLICLPTAPRASLGRSASGPPSNGRSERSLATGLRVLHATRSAQSVEPRSVRWAKVTHKFRRRPFVLSDVLRRLVRKRRSHPVRFNEKWTTCNIFLAFCFLM